MVTQWYFGFVIALTLEMSEWKKLEASHYEWRQIQKATHRLLRLTDNDELLRWRRRWL